MNAQLPNLVVAGVTKAGTTALFGYLAQHPEVCPARLKGTHYFSPLRFDQPLPALDQCAEQFAHCSDERYRLDSSPDYFAGGRRLVAEMRSTLPEPRILITLRNPVDRLWSGYAMKLRRSRVEPGVTFETFLDRCLEVHDRGTITAEDRVHSALTTGFYARYLPTWFDVFGDSVRVLFFERWSRNPGGEVGDLCRWLDIDATPAAQFDYTPRNRGAIDRSSALRGAADAVNRRAALLLRRAPRVKTLATRAYRTFNTVELSERMQPATRRRLEELYREPNAQLAELLRSRGVTELAPWLDPAQDPGPAPAETPLRP